MISRAEPTWFCTWYAYLIRLDRPLGSDRHKARYYLGIACNWQRRFIEHCTGVGAKMLKYAIEHGRSLQVLRVWQFDSAHCASSFEVWGKHCIKNHQKLLKVTIPN